MRGERFSAQRRVTFENVFHDNNDATFHDSWVPAREGGPLRGGMGPPFLDDALIAAEGIDV